MQNKRTTSDDGYGTDSPTISPSKELNVKQINRESREFRTKYFTEKVLNNSANGVIYQGKGFYLKAKHINKFSLNILKV